MRALELLAPARNKEIGIAAIDCGADAVYLAGPAFGARRAAGNSVEDIAELCRYAHSFGARVFVTLNTIIYEGELDEAYALALALQRAGADALIVQDFALPYFELEHPDELTVPLHASTQCSVRTLEDARRLDALGFSRIVLERELPLSAVREICSAVSCEVETFVHGALCVCYSGQCYLSQMLAGRSANRGECVQACRSRYDLVDADGRLIARPDDFPADAGQSRDAGRYAEAGQLRDAGRYSDYGHGGDFLHGGAVSSRRRPLAQNRTLLSLKDLNLIGRLPEMAEAGVCSFKIEGRLKGISYVRNVVAAYSQALDRLVAAQPELYRRASCGRSDCGFTPRPEKSFNRGFTELFFDGMRGSWACLDAGKALGEEVGTVSSVSRTKGGMRISLGSSAAEFHNGDGFSFIGRDGVETGFRADVCEGNTVFCGSAEGLAPGMRLYRNLDAAFEKEVAAGAVRRIRVALSVAVSETGGGQFRFEIRAVSEDGRTVFRTEDILAEPARNRERMLCIIREQLCKDTGLYRFSSADISCGAGSALPLLPVARLNGMRRSIAAELDSLPCGSVAMNRAAIRDSLPEELRFPKRITYKSDVANSLAAEFYRRLGAETVEPAYELGGRGMAGGESGKACDGSGAHGGGVELMRSRYCLLHELGFCRKSTSYARLLSANNLKDGLFIRNNGRLLRLGFDCGTCEMTVSAGK